MESSLNPTLFPSDLTPSNTKLKIALCQLTVSCDKAANLAHARHMMELAANKAATLLVLPLCPTSSDTRFRLYETQDCQDPAHIREMWVCPYSEYYIAKCAENLNDKSSSPAFSLLAEVASKYGITIIGGSIPEENNGKLYNTCCVFGPEGKLLAKHRKLHLFDYFAAGDTFRESDTFTAGDAPTIVNTDVGLIGIGICHDIRFPELAMLYKAKGANMVIYPAAFNLSTGKALWELEAKARAVDNQLFIATCSPSRASSGSYTIWGHSNLVGPVGDIKATAGPEESMVIAEVDYFENNCVRKMFPYELHKKEDIYRLMKLQ